MSGLRGFRREPLEPEVIAFAREDTGEESLVLINALKPKDSAVGAIRTMKTHAIMWLPSLGLVAAATGGLALGLDTPAPRQRNPGSVYVVEVEPRRELSRVVRRTSGPIQEAHTATEGRPTPTRSPRPTPALKLTTPQPHPTPTPEPSQITIITTP